MRCWWQSSVYAPLGEVQSPCRSHFGTRFHPSSTDANVPFIWWVKRFLVGKRGCHPFFSPQNGHQLKKMTNKPFAAQWDVFNKVYQHTSNSHPWSPPLKCVLKYEKYRLRRKVASSNTYRANHNKVSSSWQPKLDILKRGGEQDSIFFLLSQTFFLKRPGQNWFKLSSYY